MTAAEHDSMPDIEEDIERTRHDIDETLERLREKLDPAAHLREAADEVGRGVASLYGHEPGSPEARREVGRLVADNLLPIAVIAGGCLWLVAREIQRTRRRSRFERYGAFPEAPLAGTPDLEEGPGPAPVPRQETAGVADDPLARPDLSPLERGSGPT